VREGVSVIATGRKFLFFLKTLGDRFSAIPRWSRDEVREMVTGEGVEAVSAEEGGQIVLLG
jgi:hypothetical protein